MREETVNAKGGAERGKRALLGLSEKEIAALLPPSAPSYTARQIRAFCFAGKDIDGMTSLSKALRADLKEEFVTNPVSVMRVYASRDGSKKYLFSLPDDNLIEGVFMPHDYGNTLCVSTQVGCRMHCAFCASGADGLVRDLTFSEILGEVVAVNAAEGGSVKTRAVTNIVLMGSGEPFDNRSRRLGTQHLPLHFGARGQNEKVCGERQESHSFRQSAFPLRRGEEQTHARQPQV